jgi:tRNA 2-thiouridine synthesizing protein B
MLHLIFQSPIETVLFERFDSGDVIVFLENAVLRLLQDSQLAETLKQQLSKNRLCVLTDDLTTRGINAQELISGIEVIDYSTLVELTVSNPVIQSWTL